MKTLITIINRTLINRTLTNRTVINKIKKVHIYNNYSNFLSSLVFSSVFALLTAYSAQVKFFLYWTPVPITLQTFVVILSGILLGSRWGAVSQIIYVMLGVCGAPLFSGMSGGLGVILGPRGGYIIGFILTSFFIGRASEKYLVNFKFFKMFFYLLIISFVTIYSCGCFGLYLFFKFFNTKVLSLYDLLIIGFFPFVIGDLIKVFLSTVIIRTYHACFTN